MKQFKRYFFAIVLVFAFQFVINLNPLQAEVTIDAGLTDATFEYNPSPCAVFINATTGYVFNVTGGNFVYRKTTDGGKTWAAAVTFMAAKTSGNIAVWYDRWTPNDNAGTRIHIAASETGTDDTWYHYLDTATDTLRPAGAIAVRLGASYALADGGPTICKSTEGYLYIACFSSTAAHRGVSRSVNGGDAWVNITPGFLFDDDDDHCQLLPLAGGDVLCIYNDMTASQGLWFVWEEDTDTWSASATVLDTWTENATYNACFGATCIRNTSSNDIYLSANNSPNNASGDLKAYKFTDSTHTWAVLTDILTDTNGCLDVKMFRDLSNGDLYAIYVRGWAENYNQVFSRKSTDGGNTWGPETLVSYTSDDHKYVRTNLMSADIKRIFWYNDDLNDLLCDARYILTWQGLSRDFDDPNNWSPAIAPTNAYSLIIPQVGSGNYPLIDSTTVGANQNCKALTINTGANIQLNGLDLTCYGPVVIEEGGELKITNGGSQFNIRVSYENYGTLTNTEGDVVLQGPGDGPVAPALVKTNCAGTGKSFKFLRIPAYARLSDGVTLEVTGTGGLGFQLNGGYLYAGNNTTLITYDSWGTTTGKFYKDTSTVILKGTGNIPYESDAVLPYEFYNLQIDGTFSVAGTNQYVYNHLTITENGSLAASTYNIYGYGNWVNNGSFNASSAEVQLIGTSSSAITGTTQFNIVRFGDGTNAKTITLQSGADIKATNTLEIKANAVLNGSPTGGPNATLTIPSGCMLTIGGTWQPRNGTFIWQKDDTQEQLPALANGFYKLIVDPSGSGNVTPNGALNIGSDFYIKSGTFNGGNVLTHTIGGDWIQDGAFSSGTSTIIFNGADCEILKSPSNAGSLTFNSLTSSGTLTKIEYGKSIVVTGNFNITAGTFNAGTATVFTISTWTDSGAFNAGTSEVIWKGGQIPEQSGGNAHEDFYSLTVDGTCSLDGANSDKTFTINKHLKINSTKSLDAGSPATPYNIELKGNFQLDGSFTAGNSKLLLNGTVKQTLNGSTSLTINNLEINKTTGDANAKTVELAFGLGGTDLTINGTTNILAGILNLGSTADTVVSQGNITVGNASGTDDSIISMLGGVTLQMGNGTVLEVKTPDGILESAQSGLIPLVTSTNPGTNFYYIKIAGKTRVNGLQIKSIGSAGTFTDPGANHGVTILTTADIYSAGDTYFDQVTFDDIQGSGTRDTYLRVFRNASSPQLSLEFNKHKYDDGAVDANADVNVYLNRGSTGSTIIQSMSSGNKGGTNAETYDMRDDSSSPGDDPDPGSIQWPINKVWTGLVSDAWNVDGNWKLEDGSPTEAPGGSDSITIPSNPDSNPDKWPVISANASVKNITLQSPISAVPTTVLSVNGSWIFTIYGTWTINDYTNCLFDPGTSTVDYAGSSGQGVVATTYYNLQLSNTSGLQMVFEPIIIYNDCTILGGVNFIATTTDVRVEGNWNNYGTFSPGNCTIKFQGNSGGQEQNITGGQFRHLEFSGSESKKINGTTEVLGNVSIAGGATVNATDQSAIDIKIGGNFTVTGTFSAGLSTIIFNGAAAQELIRPAGTISFNNLKLLNTGTSLKLVQQSGGATTQTITISTSDNAGNTNLGNINIGTGTTLDATNDIINCGGNWLVNGSFTYDGSTVSLNASAAQAIKTNSSFYTLNIANSHSSDYVTFEGNITVNNNLNITDGQVKLDIGTALNHGVADNVTIAGGAKLEMGISNLVIGNSSVFGDLSINGQFIMSSTGTAAPTLKLHGDSGTVNYTVEANRPDITVNGTFQTLWSNGAKPLIQAYNPITPGPFYCFAVKASGIINVNGLVIDSAYTYDSVTTIFSALLLEPGAVCSNLNNVDYQNIMGGVSGTYRGLQFRIASGTYIFDGCSFDDTCTYNVRTDNGTPTINMTNAGGTRGVSTYEDQVSGTINWIANRIWNGGATDIWTNTANWDGALRADTTDETAIINRVLPNGYNPRVRTASYTIRNLVIKNSNTVFIDDDGGDDLTVSGDVIMEPGSGITMKDFATCLLYVQGNWDNQGGILDQQSTGGIIYLRGVGKTISTETGFRKLSIDTAGTSYTLVDGATVAISGTSASYFINATAMLYGGNNTNPATLKASVWATNLNRFDAGNSKFVWMGTTNVPLETYYDLQIGSQSDGYNISTTYAYSADRLINRHLIVDAGSTLTLNQTGGTLIVKGNIWVKEGATLNLNNATVRLEGDFIIDGVVNGGTSTVIFGGGINQKIRSTVTPPSLTLNDIQITPTTIAELNMPITTTNINSGLASPHGIIKLNSYQLVITGQWNDSDAGDNLTEDTGTVYFYGTSATIPNETWYDLKVGAPSADTTYTLPNNTTVKNDITFNENGIINSGGFALYVARHWIDNGSEDNFTEGAGTVQFNGTVQQNVSGETFNNLIITNTGVAVSVIAQGKLTVSNNLTISNGTLDFGSGFVGGNKHTIGGYCYIDNGKLKLNTSSISITGLLRIGDGSVGSGILDMTANSTDDPDVTATGGVNVTSTGTLDVTGSSASITAGGNWVRTGSFNLGQSKVILSGDGNYITTTGTSDFYALHINAGSVISASTDCSITNNLVVTGQFGTANKTVAVSGNITNGGIIYIGEAAAAGTLDLEGDFTGGSLRFINGGSSLLYFSGASFAPTDLMASNGTIIFDNTLSGQTIPSYTYNNIRILKSGQTATAGGNLAINGTLNVSSGIFDGDDGSARVHTIGAISNSGTVKMDLASTINVTGNTINASQVDIGIGTYNNAVNYTNTGGTTTLGAGLLDINGNLTGGTIDFNNTTGTLRIAGTFTPTTLNEDAGTIIFDGTGQAIPAESYYNLKTGSINTTYTLGGAIQVKGNLTIDETDDATKSTLDVSGSNHGITCTGNWQLNGTFNPQGGMVEFNGTAPALNISKGTNGTALSFNNLKVNIGPSSVLQPNAPLTIGNSLQVSAGEFDLSTGLSHSINGITTIDKIMDINGSQLSCANNLSVSASGGLIMRDNAVLKMADAKPIAIAGGFTTYWGGGGATKPKITTSGAVGTNSYSFDANSGSSVDISGLTIESINANGLKINTGANILDIDDVAFASQVAPTGGAALNLQVTSGYNTTQSFTFSDMGFDGSYKGSAGGPSSTIGNVVVGDNANGVNVTITLSNANDVVPGQEDWDYDDPTPGDGNAVVNWVQLNTWIGNTTSWNLAGNWTNGIPDGTKDVLIPTTPAGGNFPILDTTGNCIGLKIENGACLTESGSGAYNLEIKGDILIEGNGTFDAGDGKVIFNGLGSQTVDLGSVTNNEFYKLDISKASGTITLLRDLTIENNLAVTGTLNTGNKTLTINGATTNNGIIQVANGVLDTNNNLTGGTLTFGTGQLRFSGVTFSPITLTAGSGTIIFDGKTADQNIPVYNYYNLEIDKYSGSVSYTANAGASGLNVEGNFTVTSGIFKADPINAGWSHSIAGNYNINAANSEFNPGLSIITLDGVSQLITQNNNSFYKLNIGDDAATPSVTINTGNNLIVANNLVVNTGSSLIFNSNTGHSIGGTLVIDNTSTLNPSSGRIVITGSMTNNGMINMTNSSAYISAASFTNIGTLDFGTSSAAGMAISGNWNDSNTVNPGYSTITLTGGASSIIATAGITDFYHLVINGSYTASNALDIEGSVTIGGTFNPDIYTHKIAGNWNDSAGTFSTTNGTIRFDGTGSRTITTKLSTGGNKFKNLEIGNDTNTPSFTIVSGDLVVNGNLIINTGSGLTINSNTGHSVSGSVTIDPSATLFIKTGQINVGAVGNNGTIDLTETTGVNGKLTASSVTNGGLITFGTSASGKITCNGTFINSSGTFTKGNSTLEIGGSTTNLNAPTTNGSLYNLTVSGTVSAASSINIDNNLAVNSSCSFNLGTVLTTTVNGVTSVSGMLNINNSIFVANNNLTVYGSGTLQIVGSNINGQQGQLKIADGKIVSMQGFLQTNPSGTYTYKPVVTHAAAGARYSFNVESGGKLDINALIFEYANSNGLTIASNADISNIDIDNTDFRYVLENPSGTKQGNGARYLYIGFASGSFAQTFDSCTFDNSFGINTGNNIIGAATTGSNQISLSNYGGLGSGPAYEWESNDTDVQIKWLGSTTWEGNNSSNWNDNGNWSNGVPGSENSAVVVYPASGRNPVMDISGACASLEIKTNGTLDINGKSLTITGNFILASTGILQMTTANSQVIIGGNWSNTGGTLNQTAGLIVFNGTNTIISSEQNFRAVSITGTASLASGSFVKVSGIGSVFAVQGGIFNLSNATFNTNSWSKNGTFISDTGTFVWMGTTALPAENYYHLQVGDGVVSFACSMATFTYNISKNLTIKMTGNPNYLDAGSATINIGGNLTIDGSVAAYDIFRPSTSNIKFNGNTTQAIGGTAQQPFVLNDLNISGISTIVSLQGNVKLAESGVDTGDINPDLTAPLKGQAGILKLNSYTMEVQGNYNDDSNDSISTAPFNDNISEDTGTVYFNGDQGATPLTVSFPIETYYDLIAGSGGNADIETYNLVSDTTVSRSITITSNSLLDVTGGNYSLAIGGNFTLSGTFNPQSGTVAFNGNINQNITANSNFYHLITNNTGVGTSVLAQGKLAVNGNLTISNGTLDLGTGFIGGNKHTIGGYCYIDKGKLKANTSSIGITGLLRIGDGINTGILDMTSNSTDDPDLTAGGGVNITSTGTLDVTGSSASISSGGNWVRTGSFNLGQSKITLSGAGNYITTTGTGDFYALHIASGSVISAGSNCGITNNLVVTGQFGTANKTVSINGNITNGGIIYIGQSAAAGTLDLEGDFTGGSLRFINGSGSLMYFSGANFTPSSLTAADGTIIFDNTISGQTIPSYTYNNIRILKSGQTSTSGGNLTINGTLNVTNGIFDGDDGSIRVHTIGTISNSGTVKMDLASTINVTGNTINASQVDIGIGTYNNAVNYTNTGGTTTLGAGLLDINGNLNGGTIEFNNSTGILRIAGTFAPTTLNEDAGTIIFDGTGQAIPAESYYNLKTGSINTTYTLGGAIQVKGNLTIDETDDATKSTLDISGNNYGITCTGNWQLNGTFNPQGGMVEFNGTAPALNISKGTNGTALSFNNLKVNIGATSVLQPNAALTIGGNLQVNAGEFDLNTGLNHSVSGLSTIEKTLDINGSQLTCSDNFTVSNQGSLILRDNAVLKIANNKAIAINGAFTTYWGGGGATKPKITTSGVIGTDSYSFDANSGSNIDISGLTVESVDASGLKINTGANILDIDDVAFASQAAPIGGAALNLQVTSGYVSTQSFTFSDMSFDGSYKGSAGGPSATIGNVVVADNAQGVTVTITLSNANDVTPGQEDWDYDDPTPGNGNAVVNWVQLNTWVGTTTSWNLTGNWTNGIPDGSKDILIPTAPAGGNFPVLDTTGNCIGLKIENGACLTESGSGTYNLEVKGDFIIEGNGTFGAGDGKVILDGNGTQSIDLGIAGSTYYNLEINKSTGTVTVSRDLTITNNLSVTGTLTSAGKTVTINGTTANNGTIQLANGIFDINGNLSGGIIDGGTGTIRFSGATFNPTTLAPNLGTIVFDNKALDQTIPALNYHHLEIDKYSGSASYTANAASSGINIDGNFKVTSGIFKADPTNAGWSHTIAGNYDINTANSEFNAGLSTITLDGISQSITQNNNSFYKLNIGNGTATPTIQMTGNLKTGGNLTVKAGSTLALNSNNGHTVGGSITIENTGRIDLTTGTAAITGGLTNSGTVDMDQASILNCNAFTNTGTGVLDFGSAASQITVSGNWDDSGTVNPGNSTINLTAGSGTITTSNSTDFYSLNINGSYTANNALDIVGNITINGSFNPGSFSHRIAGNWNDSSGTFTGGTSNIIFVGTSQSINTDVGSGNNKFYTLTIGDGTATPSVSVTSGKDLEISNNLVIRSGCQLTLNSNVVHTVGGSCTITGTLNTSTGKITISGAVTNSGSLDASSSVAASQGLKSAGLTNTGTINFGVSGSGMIECDGNWVDTGAFTLGNSTVKIIGSARTIKSNRATGDFYKLIVSGSASIDSGSSNGLDVDSTLLVNNSASLDLGTGFTNDVAATCDVGDTSTTGTLNINNSKLIVHGNLTVKNNSTLIIKGSNTAANVGELRMGNNATVYIEGSFQTNPSGSYTYKPKVTRASSGERYDFTVQNSGGIDINALIFEYAKKYGLTIASTAAITNIDIDDADFQNVEEDPTGTGQGNGARHLYIGFASGSYTGNFDTCSFDQSFGTATGNNVVCAATSGSTSLNFSNWQGNNGGGDQYEYESSGTSIIWIATNTWVGGASGHETAWNWGANWNTGSKPGAGSSVIIPSRAYAPSLNESVIIASLEVQDGGILNMSAGYQLIVNGTASIVTGTTGGKINITNSGAVLTCKSDLLDNNAAGGINQTAGKVVLLGTNSTFYSATIKTLEIGDGNQTVNINIPSGKTVKLAANGTLTVKSNAAYYLQGGTLVLGNGLTINVNSNGTFKADNNTAITTPAPGTDRFYFIVNGAVNLDTCEIRSMTANGLDIQSTAVTPTLKNISFYNHPGTSNSRYISIALANLNIDSPDCWFETITTGYNVSATGASSVIRFQDRFQKKEEQNDLITQAGSNIITSISATFTTKNVMNGDILRIEQGMDIGTYVISAVNSQTELTLTSNLTASDNGIKYSIGTMSSGRGAGEPFDYDDDSNDDGVADGTGAVVLWTYTPGTQAQGQIEGFPTIAFDLNTYAYYSTYLPSKNIQGPNTVDRIYVMDSQGAFKDYYYNIDNSYGDIVGQVWWYTEGTDHTVYFGTTGGHLFRLIDTGSELQLSPGWPLDVPGCTEITSPVITDGINLYFGGMNGVTPKIYAVVITSREVLFARTAASPVRSIPSWDMSGGTTYLFVGSDYQELAGGNDLQITAGEPYVTSTSAFFLTVGLEAGDILIISSGSQQGRYRITAVNSLTELTVNYTFTSNESGIVYSAGQTPLLYRLDISNQANDKQNNSPLDSVRAPTTYWPFTNGLYVGDYYGLMHGIDVWSATFTNTDSFPYTPAVKNSIKVMAYVMFIYHDPPNGPETRLLYADTGGYFYSLKMNGTAYDPDKGGSITPYPLLLGGGTAIESSPMPNNTGLIYIGNNDGKIFVIDESQKAVIKTFSFGSGIKIGDINYDSDNRRFLIPTDQGKIYYLENMLDPTP